MQTTGIGVQLADEVILHLKAHHGEPTVRKGLNLRLEVANLIDSHFTVDDLTLTVKEERAYNKAKENDTLSVALELKIARAHIDELAEMVYAWLDRDFDENEISFPRL
jgi:hypothetical protein